MNSKKKVLIVCRSFYPVLTPRAFRATELAKELARQGHEVVVYFPNGEYDYTDFGKTNNIIIRDLGKRRFREINVGGSNIEILIRRSIRRLLQILFDYPDIELFFKVKKKLRSESGYDILISIAVPHSIHWGVANVWRRGRKPAGKWIADCGDPFMLARLDTFKKPFYFSYFEKKFCRKCDYITVPFEEMKNQFYKEFKTKIQVIPQGFNLSEIKRCEERNLNGKPQFIFAGSVLPGKRDLSLFLEFLLTYDKNYLFIVYTQQPLWFEKYKRQLGDKLVIKGYIDRISLIYEMSKADFLLNVDTILDDSLNIEAIPSKLIDYALSGRPILSIRSGSVDKEKILAFLSGDYSKSRRVDITSYDIKKIAEKFLSLS